MLSRMRSAVSMLAASAGIWVPCEPVAGQADPPAGHKADIFSSTGILPIHITMTAKEYDAMQPAGNFGRPGGGFGPPPKTADARESHSNTFGLSLPWAFAAIEIRDTPFAKVGIRYKGNGTLIEAARSIKKSFKIDLDRHDQALRYEGLKTLNLHSGVADPTKARETLGYATYRAAGVPASRTALAEVTLTVPGRFHKELLGLYTIVEQMDKPFLTRHFKTDKGLLLKPERINGLNYLGDDWEPYKNTYLPKRDATPAEQKRVIDFARLVNNSTDPEFNKNIASYLDVDAFLRFMAVTALEANMDSFFTLGHNYCLYLHPETNQFHFIPWDLDRTFGHFPIFGTAEQFMDLSIASPGPQCRLADRLMANKEIHKRYREIVKEITSTTFTKDRLLREIDSFEDRVREVLAREARSAAARREGGPGGGFGPPGAAFGRAPDLRTFVTKRTESVAAQLAGKRSGYVPQNFGPPGGGPNPGNQLAGPLVNALDTNRDGKVSEEELAVGMKKYFVRWDSNGDGMLDPRELAEGLQKLLPAPKGGPFGPPPKR